MNWFKKRVETNNLGLYSLGFGYAFFVVGFFQLAGYIEVIRLGRTNNVTMGIILLGLAVFAFFLHWRNSSH